MNAAIIKSKANTMISPDNYLSHASMFSPSIPIAAPIPKEHTGCVKQTNNLSYAKIVSGNKLIIDSTIDDCVKSDKGGFIAIKINQTVYEQQLLLCKNALIARIVLAKGESPWKLFDLKKKLTSVWNLKSEWKLISMGRGYYHVILNTMEEKNAIWGKGVIALKPGTLRLQPWSPDFDPSIQRTTNAQIWVRLYKLPWEYWHSQILSSIARGIGVPLKIDQATANGEFGHYARVLIDVDLSTSLPESLMIERIGKSFFIDIVYENLPSFCNICSNIGHMHNNCRWAAKPSMESHPKNQPEKLQKQKNWKPKATEILVSNAFKQLQSDLSKSTIENVVTLEEHNKLAVAIVEEPEKLNHQEVSDAGIQETTSVTEVTDPKVPSAPEDLEKDDAGNDEELQETAPSCSDCPTKANATKNDSSWDDIMEEEDKWKMVQRKQSSKHKYKVTLSKRITKKPEKLNL
ncbi:uncharacterized protein LOC126673551 [Mercurialis annua]|uniref:uncharacterized protein LOC126673551 n=1 Tax=Mercurialis annua TaxID=3986 RepID=UPI002160EA6C|nr:uncharacterized protein LOC126673551 [Mercurialis annua]